MRRRILASATKSASSRRRLRAAGATSAIALTTLCIAITLLPSFAAPATTTITGETMGTTWSVKFIAAATNAPAPATLRAAVQAELDRLEAQLSNYRADSAVSRFNASRDTNWFPVPPETARVVREALTISQFTDGAFDVTVEPLVRLWGFGPDGRPGAVPSDAAIAAARGRVGWRHLEARVAGGINASALRKATPELSIDLGGIGKGFAAGVVSELLTARGLTNHLVALAGELTARGPGAEGKGWRVGIEAPGANPPQLARVLHLRDAALSTSGTARNAFTAAGRSYSHLIDPRTGRPVELALMSVSVCHASSTLADALATALAVLEVDEGTRLAERNGWAALFLTRESGTLVEKPTAEFMRRFPRE